MKSKKTKLILTTVVGVLSTACLAFAGFRGHHGPAHKSADIDFTETIKVPNGPTLQPGTYKVALLNDSSAPEVGFYRNGKLVGEAPVKLVDQAKKIQETEVDSDLVDGHTRMITEIVPSHLVPSPVSKTRCGCLAQPQLPL